MEVAARITGENDCGVVPVVDREGRAIGMVTDRDLCMAGFTQGQTYWQIPVSDSLRAAEETMRAHRVRRLAVIDEGGKLVGLLSLSDLAVHATHEGVSTHALALARTLSTVCEHRRAASAKG